MSHFNATVANFVRYFDCNSHMQSIGGKLQKDLFVSHFQLTTRLKRLIVRSLQKDTETLDSLLFLIDPACQNDKTYILNRVVKATLDECYDNKAFLKALVSACQPDDRLALKRQGSVLTKQKQKRQQNIQPKLFSF